MVGWNDIPSIEFIVKFNETETTHELDFVDFSTMVCKVALHVLLGSVAWKVAQVETSRRDWVRHGGAETLQFQGP
jgi:hypothetical protein